MRPYQRIHPAPLPAPQPGAVAAQHALFAAIIHAHQHDLLPLLKDALAAGASLQARDGSGCDVFEIAIHHDRPHAIGTLLALGAHLPYVAEGGIDLLMRAAMLDHHDCCDELIANAGLDFFACDHQGRSALFHAAQEQSIASVQVLLQAGADPNQSTYRLNDESLRSLFGHDQQLNGLKVTPLMVATVIGDGALVDMLIENGALPDDGDFPPLHIAAKRHDHDMIERLLRHGADVAASLDAETNCPLHTALVSDAPLRCLRLLSAHYPFAEDDLNDKHRPLLCAIKHNKPDAVALFLSLGAQPCIDAHDPSSSWRIAADLSDEVDLDAQILQLLATTRADRWVGSEHDTDRAGVLFDSIARTYLDLAWLASEGLYPSLLHRLRAQLLSALPTDDWPSVPQKALYTAASYLAIMDAGRISDDTAALPSTSSASSAAVSSADLQWRERTNRCVITQRSCLREAATLLVNANWDRLTHTLTLDFFAQMTADCPDKLSVDVHMTEHLRHTSGLPTSTISLLATAWQQAARDAQSWFGDACALQETERFVVQRMLALAVSEAELKHAQMSNPVSAAWLEDLQRSALDKLALRRFAADPVAWLMRQEQRHDFRAVDTAVISRALSCELGLPPEASNRIADAWANAVQQLATGMRGHEPRSWWRGAARALSPAIAVVIANDESHLLPRAVRDLAERWCVPYLGTLPGRVSAPVILPDHGTVTSLTPLSTPNPTAPRTAPPPPSPAALQPPPRPPAGTKRPAEEAELNRKRSRRQ